ncbi:uncharacterized protein DUF2125 [Shimia isoporae]|uniref:Uncharacterized protein DUF2125 n=1 Tax=Shimia isoporae TaxID=647720 RepID=A0A4R1NB87_9RHOB|nr:DUF2125 domain-containing protein [Shimia isoporae]TCL00686.1 uncharacterized protein DUF2125 [Shimia isoporae]
MRIYLTSRLLAGSTAIALCSGPVFADITAQDAWSNWRAYMEEFGYEIQATEEAGAGSLAIKDLVATMDMPEESGQAQVNMSEMVFTENGEGAVSITIADSVPFSFSMDDGDEQVTANIMMTHAGLSTIASGNPDEITYAYGAENVTMALQDLVVNGETISDFSGEIAVNGIDGTTQFSLGETMTSKDSMSAEQLSVMIKGVDPDTGDNVDFAMTLAGLNGTSEGTMPLGSFTSNPSAMFADSLDLVADFTMQAAQISAAFEDEEGPGQLNLTTGPGAVDVEMTDELMSYGGKITDVAASVAAPDIPLPIDVTFGELGYDFAVPLKASEEAQDFNLGLNFTDIGLSEFIWNLFDPGAILPRDAATLVLGLSGKATVFQDLVTLDENMSEAPGELNALSLDELQLSAAGADVSGTGSFTFDNTDLVSFDGLPRPEGAIDVKLKGINGLIDKLIQMGLLPEEQAMPARMMLGMFSVPVGEDELTSRIEINEAGHVLANGQRLK